MAHQMHNATTPNEKLFPGKLRITWYVHKNRVHHYAINSLLYLRTLKEKYVKRYEEFIMQLCNKNFGKRLFTNLSYITNKITRNSKHSSNGTLNDQSRLWLHLYYNMKLVTFGIDKRLKFNNSIQSIYPTIYVAATDSVSDRNSISSDCKSQ